MLGYIPFGGGDFADVAGVAARVGEGDDNDFYEAWMAAGDRVRAEAGRVDAAGHPKSAGDLYLRASAHYASAYHPLYGTPVDPRLLEAYRRQISCFEAGLARRKKPVLRQDVEFEGATLPLYLIPAEGHEDEPRPTIIFINGYDATVTDVFFASAVAALRRGYHCVVFDGPGQGGVLYEQGVPLRPDWETVTSAAIDAIVSSPIVDQDRIAVSGWSLGGYLAPRAASGERRIAACVADPGQWDLGAAVARLLLQFGASESEASGQQPLGEEVLKAVEAYVAGNRMLHWAIVQRGFWANGVSDLSSFLDRTREFTSRDLVGQIDCPVLLTRAENDPLAADVAEMAAAIPNAMVMDFTAADGAGEHCEMSNRSLLNRRVLDWLDEVLVAN